MRAVSTTDWKRVLEPGETYSTGQNFAYSYDAVGNRVAQTVNGAATHYLLDLLAPLPEVIAATQGASSTRYVQVGGQVLAQREAGTWQYVLPDHLGSVRQLADGAGGITLQQSYRPFGEQLERTGTTSSLLGFTGEPVDVTGLVHLRARYYSPAQGQFLTPDPFKGWQTLPSSLHPYQYGYSNPVRFTDPSGENPLCVKLGISTAILSTPAGGFLSFSACQAVTFAVVGGTTLLAQQACVHGCDAAAQLLDELRYRIAAQPQEMPSTGDFPLLPQQQAGVTAPHGSHLQWPVAPGFALGNWNQPTTTHNPDPASWQHLVDGLRHGGFPLAHVQALPICMSVGDDHELVPARNIRYTQDTISPHTKKPWPIYLDDLIGNMADYGYRGPPINVVEKDGKLYSLDHRRLVAAQILGIDVPIVVQDLSNRRISQEYNAKSTGLSTGTEGEYIDVKGTGIRIYRDGSVRFLR
jgi:RHS repeat-associated protein